MFFSSALRIFLNSIDLAKGLLFSKHLKIPSLIVILMKWMNG